MAGDFIGERGTLSNFSEKIEDEGGYAAVVVLRTFATRARADEYARLMHKVICEDIESRTGAKGTTG